MPHDHVGEGDSNICINFFFFFFTAFCCVILVGLMKKNSMSQSL